MLRVIDVVLGKVRTQYVVPAMILPTDVADTIGMPIVNDAVLLIAGEKVTTFVTAVVAVIMPMNCALAIFSGRPI